MQNVKKIDAFWDSSAMVPLCVGQGPSAFVRAAMRNRSIVVWWATSVEMTSAFSGLLRSGEISQRSFRMALARLAELRKMWIEVQPTEPVRDLAEELVQRHPLRAADAIQLAAALIWSRRHPRRRAFVCFDGRLAEAAGKEGFSVEAL
ncbi:MAG: type II toxin-antitoxin system VapC family toxin [Acidobacteriia bacterium]|nr:type II toxin-antitoxin system VapC family toxin [Terriglobia bacterium]